VRVHRAQPRVEEQRVGGARAHPQRRRKEDDPEAEEQLGEQRREAAEREPEVQGERVAE
jgi:hypothetical protein